MMIMMWKRFVVLFAAVTCWGGVPSEQRPGTVDSTTYAAVRALAPPLVHRYADEGLWDWSLFELNLRSNPYYVRGDFTGDGIVDTAVHVRVLPHRVNGLAVLHGEVDKLRLFTERRDLPAGPYLPDSPRIEEVETGYVGEHLRILAAGTRIEPFPCAALRRPDCDDSPFTLRHDAFEANYFGKSAVLFVWRGDRYVRIVTSD